MMTIGLENSVFRVSHCGPHRGQTGARGTFVVYNVPMWAGAVKELHSVQPQSVIGAITPEVDLETPPSQQYLTFEGEQWEWRPEEY